MHTDDTLPDGAVRIPLRAMNGSIRAYAIVDAADAAWVNQWRWCLSDGYAVRAEWDGTRYHPVRLHRALLGLKRGDERDGDHEDRDKLNCRRSNLRIVPKGANSQNQPGHADSTSIYRGVSWHKRGKKWRACVRVDGRQIALGLYDDEEEAARVAREARLRLLPYAVD